MLHAQAGKYNEQFKRATFDKQPYGDNVVEFNPHLDEEIPYVAGFVGKDGELIKESEFYLDDDAKSNKTLSAKRLQKRGEYDNDSLSYDYEGFKAEYEQEIKEMAKKNDTLKYSEIKEEETPNEAVKTLIDFSAKNCTSDDLKSMSINSARCLWLEMKKPHFDKRERLNLLEKLAKLVAIWFIIYLLIALPLWCQYGWCCCCCRCKFCRPLEQIDEVKTFFENNPVGVFRDETGKVFAYEPTDYEKYAQKKLQKAIYSL
ncbi:uncharacterized protein LOC132697329 [Cylas formicarius]|uniref:uncharacterized protein LOC132697329 n=1 Tax=Cylas formicarius TaxID=197179 RepID=UPI002958640C|nr:uncharacterized protein LOC132697329 [Cylas formicarius]